MATDWVHGLTVVKLKEELKSRELPTAGKKADLVKRLETYLTEQAPQDNENEPSEKDDEKVDVAAEETSKQEDEIKAKPDDVRAEEVPAGESNVVQGDEVTKPAVKAPQSKEDRKAEASVEPASDEPEVEPKGKSGAGLAKKSTTPPAEPVAEVPDVDVAPEKKAAETVEEVVDLDYGEEDMETTASKRVRDASQVAEAVAPATKLAKRETAVPEAVIDSNASSRALRIDGFVRPLTERAVRALLDPEGTQLKALWMPSLKTHCYAVFSTKAGAGAAFSSTAGLRWPTGSPKVLEPKYVTLAEAELAIGQGAGNPEFKVARTAEDVPEEPAAVVASAPKNKAGTEKKKVTPPKQTTPTREWDRDKPALSPPATSSKEGGVKDLRELLQRRKSGAEADSSPPKQDNPVTEKPADTTAPKADEEMKETLTLDELFKKTEAKPVLYWLPLTDEQVAAKKEKAVAENFELPPRLTLKEELARCKTQRQTSGRKEGRKGEPWTEAEHAAFLAGLQQLGKGQWKHISHMYVPSRTPTQVASHAQKHFLRAAGVTKRRSRFTAVEAAVLPPQATSKTLSGAGSEGETSSEGLPIADGDSSMPASSSGLAGSDINGLLSSPGVAALPRYSNGIPILPTTPGRVKVTYTYDPSSTEARNGLKPIMLGEHHASPGSSTKQARRRDGSPVLDAGGEYPALPVPALDSSSTPGRGAGTPSAATRSAQLATLGALSLQLQGTLAEARKSCAEADPPADLASAVGPDPTGDVPMVTTTPVATDKPSEDKPEGQRRDPLAALALAALSHNTPSDQARQRSPGAVQ